MDWLLFLTVLAAVESGGDPKAVGDKHLDNKAYGLYQIRQPYLDDVNRIAGTTITMRQVRRSESIGRWCVVTYVTHYAAKSGQPLTYELASRLHNGGPNGWKKTCTDQHWQKVRVQLEKMDKWQRKKRSA